MKAITKRIIIILLLFVICLEGNAQKKLLQDVYMFSYFKDNGQDGLHLAFSYDGLHWQALKKDSSFLKHTLSNDKIMRDPCIIRGADGLFHLVWTDSWNDKGIGYSSSVDLIHWSIGQRLPVMENEANALNCWAPEITYDAITKTYMIYWATTIAGKFTDQDTLSETKYNHRLYFVTTKDFRTYSPTKLLYDPGFTCIDATIVPYGKRFVMFFKDERLHPEQKNLKIAYSERLTGPYSQPEGPITGKYWAEGPTTLRIGHKWIVYFDRYRDHQFGAITSTDLKNWTDISDKIALPNGIRHGTIFKITNKEFKKLTYSER